VGLRVLCSGDIHIGRQLSKIGTPYRTAEAWRAIVDLAVREQVDMVALAGDMIDAASKSLEALGPMRNGLETLATAGIDTVTVAGNHDYDVLPKLADQVGTERFHLLGRNGQWDRFTLHRNGLPRLHVDGWSFPSAHVTDPPLRQYPFKARDGAPVMSMLHGDVEVPLSHYAPISLGDLRALDVDLVLLGHIHTPKVFQELGSRQALYVGSPWAMDPGEPGLHGVWIATFPESGGVELERIAISPVRYEARTVDVRDVEDEDGFNRLVDRSLLEVGRDALAATDAGLLTTVSLRLHFTGESAAHRAFPLWVDRANSQIATYPVDAVEVIPERFTSDVRPPLDMHDLSRGSGPVAEVARLIVSLDARSQDQPYDELVRTTLSELRNVYDHRDYVRLGGLADNAARPTEADARALLTSRAWQMLSVLVDQRDEG
jgi:DNA repair protein SbcD/Mre11